MLTAVKRWFSTILLVTLSYLTELEARMGVNPELLKGNAFQAGLNVQITDKALEHINDVVSKAVENLLTDMKIPDFDRDLGEAGQIKLSKIERKNYKKADKFEMKFVPEDKLEWSFKGMDIGIKGNINGQYKVANLPIDINGKLDVDLVGIEFKVMVGIKKEIDGKPKIWAAFCEAKLKKMDLVMTDAGLVGDVFNLIRGEVIKQVQPQMMAEMCSQIRGTVNRQGNKLMNIMPTKFPLSGGNYAMVNSGLDPETGGFILEGLWLDMRFLHNPNITKTYFVTNHHGEISWQGEGKTPFFPIKMVPPLKSPPKMLYLYASDYMVNSAMYHAFKNGALKFRLAPEDNPMAGTFLSASCDEGLFDVCIGDIVPQLEEFYTGSKAELLFLLTRAPALIFHSSGKVKIDAPGLAFIYMRSKTNPKLKEEVMSLNIDMKGDMKISINKKDKKVMGTFLLNTFRLTLRKTILPMVNPESLEELSDMSSVLVEEVVNKQLESGLPLPSFRGLSLENPSVVVVDRVMRVETDLAVDSKYLEELAGGALGGLG